MTFKEHFIAWANGRASALEAQSLALDSEARMLRSLISGVKSSEPEADDIVISPQGNVLPPVKQADAKWLTAPPSAPPPQPAQSAMGQILCGCGIPATWWKKGQMYLCGKPYGTPKDQQCGFKRRT